MPSQTIRLKPSDMERFKGTGGRAKLLSHLGFPVDAKLEVLEYPSLTVGGAIKDVTERTDGPLVKITYERPNEYHTSNESGADEHLGFDGEAESEALTNEQSDVAGD